MKTIFYARDKNIKVTFLFEKIICVKGEKGLKNNSIERLDSVLDR